MSEPTLTPALLDFLGELADHNERDWFKANQPRYEATVREPVRAFVRSMIPVLADYAPALTADDRKVGGSMMRPQRDTRFSKDKTPYKTQVGIQFRHSAGKDVHAPGLYLNLAPGEIFLGLGMWRPPSPDLKAIRAAIDADPQEWTAIVHDPGLEGAWSLHQTDVLKRNPRGYDKEHPMGEWLRLKSHILIVDLEPEQVFDPGFLDYLADQLERGRRHAAFICGALGQPW
ncbi:MAG: DUF2461 domain-containing protein [Myxococcota bacterium]